jgi:hypothetical protein
VEVHVNGILLPVGIRDAQGYPLNVFLNYGRIRTTGHFYPGPDKLSPTA